MFLICRFLQKNEGEKFIIMERILSTHDIIMSSFFIIKAQKFIFYLFILPLVFPDRRLSTSSILTWL